MVNILLAIDTLASRLEAFIVPHRVGVGQPDYIAITEAISVMELYFLSLELK
jgi:hypothetical protein